MDGEAAELIKAGLDFARGALFFDFPRLRSMLQPNSLSDCGDGVMWMRMSHPYPEGDGNIGISNRGVLFFDITPGEPGITVAWAKRA